MKLAEWAARCSLFVVSLLLPTCRGIAAVYDFALGDPGNRTMRMTVPDGLPVVRGLLIWGNGSNSDLRAMATDPELVAFGESMGFAIIGTSMWSNFANGYTPSELSAFEGGLQQFATMSGHPEIVRAPWLPIGQSNGGCMSYGLNVLHPEKVIAIAANKGQGYNDSRPAWAALRTPGLLIAGDVDLDTRRTNIHDLFTGNRPRGALWAWVEEQIANHNTGDTFELILPFVEEVYRQRYPATATPASAPVTLLDADETSGWLTDPDSYKSGFATITAYADYPKDRAQAGWLPSRRIAYIFRAFASYSLARYEVNLSTGHGPVVWGTPARFSIGEPIADWSQIDFYDGDTLLKTLTPASAGPLLVDTFLNHPGYAVFHAIITFADGTQQTTMPRRVFVKAPVAGAVAGPRATTVTGSLVLTSAVPDSASASCQWQISTGGTWENLSDGVATGRGGVQCAGTTSNNLMLTGVPSALDGAQFRCVFSDGSKSDSVPLTVRSPPELHVSTTLPRDPVTAGTVVTAAVWSTQPNLRYQWFRNGTVMVGATNSSWTVVAGKADAGSYTVVATDNQGLSATAQLGQLSVLADAWLINLSARAYSQSGDNSLIAGFVTGGPSGSTAAKSVLIRGIGPTLGQAPFNVPGCLSGAELRLYDSAGANLSTNSGWTSELAAVFAQTGAFSLSAGSRDAALLATITPGAYTANLAPADGNPGVGLVELYDADVGPSVCRLVNISARANIGNSTNSLFGGFVIRGNSSSTYLIRAVGLGLRQFLPASLLQPVLTVYDQSGRVITTNTGWLQPPALGDSPVPAGVSAATSRAMAEAGAFLLPEPEMTGYQAGWDSAVVVTLPPGAYTAQVSSADGNPGIGLMEIYELR